MKKTLIISLTDGREVRRDITTLLIAPIGSPANDEAYAKFCQSVCVHGYTDIEKGSDEQYTHISPFNIAYVTVKFEKHGTATT